jgi:hypothetical protein
MLRKAWKRARAWLKDHWMIAMLTISVIGGAIVIAFFRLCRFIGGRGGKAKSTGGPYRDPEVLKIEEKRVKEETKAYYKELDDEEQEKLNNNPFG